MVGARPTGEYMTYHFAAALIIFLLTYALIAVRKIGSHRVKTYVAALAGGAMMLLFGIVSFTDAIDFIDMGVLMLLVGMMMITAALEYCGFFEIIVAVLMKKFDGRSGFLTGVMIITAVLTAIMLNDAVVLIFAPIVLRCCARMKADPVPFMVGVFVAANIGCTATIIGSPHNAYVASISGLGFLDYAAICVPLATICLLVSIPMVKYICRRQLERNDDRMGDTVFETRPIDKPRLTAVLVILFVALILFAISNNIGLELHDIAIVAGLMSMAIVMTSRLDAATYVVRHVDWSIVLFFLGLFVVIAGAVESGLLDSMAGIFGMDGGESSIVEMTVFSAVLANLFSNVPSVMLIGELIPHGATMLWITLAASASLAGNATLIGAADNVIVEDVGERHGIHLNFWRYLKVGIPVTVVTLLIQIIYLCAVDMII